MTRSARIPGISATPAASLWIGGFWVHAEKSSIHPPNHRGLGGVLPRPELIIEARGAQILRLFVGIDYFKKSDIAAAEEAGPVEGEGVVGGGLRSREDRELLTSSLVAGGGVGEIALQINLNLPQLGEHEVSGGLGFVDM